MQWLNYTKINVLLNRKPGKDVCSKRGLRQGHPLSLLIFALAAEGLDQMMAGWMEAWVRPHVRALLIFNMKRVYPDI